MSKIEKSKLTMPIYLNTRVVFDMLATIEDGFSDMRTVQTSESKNKTDNLGANIGTGNTFAFLNIGIKGNRKNELSQGETVSEERTHTPVSLFQKLKGQLEDADLIKRNLEELEHGDFVEVQGVLQNNPVIDILSGIRECIEWSNLFTEPTKKNKGEIQSNKIVNKQLQTLINALQVDGKKDIICETDKMSIVLPTDENYFLKNNMSEITDGNYKILGKVMRICLEDGEISLLRNTVFSKIKLEEFDEIKDAFNDPIFKPLVGDDGFKTVIKAPVVMIIPIAIYI